MTRLGGVVWIAQRTNVELFEVGDGIGMLTEDNLQYERPTGYITVSEPAGPAGQVPGLWRLEWRIHDSEGRPTNRLGRWTGLASSRDLRWRLPPPEYVIDEHP